MCPDIRYLALMVGYVIPAGAMLGAATVFSFGDIPVKEPEWAKRMLKLAALLVIIPTMILAVDAVMRRATWADMVPFYGFSLAWAGWIWRRSYHLNEPEDE